MEKIRLRIEQIAPGMKLAEPVTNAAGIPLMPAGIRLTPMFIARIKKWNIDTLSVVSEKAPGQDAAAGGSPAPRASTSVRLRIEGELSEAQEKFARTVAAEVARVFVNVRDNPLMMELRASVIGRLVAAGPGSPVGALRRGPADEVPLPVGEDG